MASPYLLGRHGVLWVEVPGAGGVGDKLRFAAQEKRKWNEFEWQVVVDLQGRG